ncbi:MAG: peptidoglycan DD-metalloendopeptidase family protein [Bacillota bacterium]
MFTKIKKSAVGVLLAAFLLTAGAGAAFASVADWDSWSWRLRTAEMTAEAELAARVNSHTLLYTVKAGDTLWAIARDLKIDLDLLTAVNGINSPQAIQVGQKLLLPVEPERQYHVRPGDTLWSIAGLFDVDVKSLMTANRLNKPEQLQAGSTIIIPGSPQLTAVSTRMVTAARQGGNYQLLWPLEGRITSPFGPRGKEFHHGLDIAGKKGDPIRAALKGTVVFSGWKNGIYGNTVIIQHDHDLMTLYAHNSRNLVQKGDRVHAGRVIAELGSTGRATGPHLHWEVHLGGKPVNPKLYVK